MDSGSALAETRLTRPAPAVRAALPHRRGAPSRGRRQWIRAGERVLIIEVDAKIAQLMADYLRAAGYQADMEHSGVRALQGARRSPPDLLILDLNLPGMDGLEVCRELRLRGAVPILMVTARIDEVERLLGLETGGDDYVCKPFSPREVVALTPAEYRMLALLLSHPGRVCGRARLPDAAHDGFRDVSDRAIDRHIRNIRRKLATVAPEADCVASAYGVGYRFEPG